MKHRPEFQRVVDDAAKIVAKVRAQTNDKFAEIDVIEILVPLCCVEYERGALSAPPTS